LVTVLGGVLRYSAVEVHSFWYDEAVSAALADATYIDLLTGAARDHGNPPLYWVLIRAVSQAFGASDTVLRMPSVISGTLTIPVVALLGRRLFSPTTGWIAALLFAINPLSLELSTEARVYALWHFLLVLNMYFFSRWLQETGRRLLALYAMTLALSVLSHYYSLVLPLAQGLVVLGFRRDRLWPWLTAAAGAAVLTLFWLPAFMSQFPAGAFPRHGATWYLQFLATPLVFEVGRTLVWRDEPLLVLGAALLLALLTFWSLAVVGLWRTWRERSVPTAVLLAAWLALPVALPFLAALVANPLYHARAGSIALPPLLLLVAYGLLALRPRLRAVMIGIIGALTLISTYRFFTEPLKDDWRAATPFLLARAQADEPLLFDPARQMIPFRLYAPEAHPRGSWYGVSEIDAVERRLLGFRYREDSSILEDYMSQVRDDNQLQDLTNDIFKQRNLWLVLYRSGAPVTIYQTLLESYGYALAEHHRYEGIDLYRFERSSGSIGTGPSGVVRRDEKGSF
jgi:hypothetical protein